MIYLYEKTKKPHIFKNCYWSGHELSDELKDDIIINNRNEFLDKYDLQKQFTPSSLWNSYITHLDIKDLRFDHLEYYRCNDGSSIILSSPYCIDDDVRSAYQKIGFIEIKPVYAINSMSFIRVFNTVRLLNKWLVIGCIEEINNKAA